MVCDKVVCESGRGGGGGRGGIQNQKQEPHTKMWGKKLDDGWPESVEEQGLLLLVLRHYITRQDLL